MRGGGTRGTSESGIFRIHLRRTRTTLIERAKRSCVGTKFSRLLFSFVFLVSFVDASPPLLRGGRRFATVLWAIDLGTIRVTGRLAQTLGKIGYGALFVSGVPLLLFLWARQTATAVGLPAVHSVAVGSVLTAAGVIFIGTGMAALIVLGKGLP